MIIMAVIGDSIGWRWTYPIMSSTPIVGLVAMQLLQRLEDREQQQQQQQQQDDEAASKP
jgi:membrane protein implicated in regulation of membrane protease activity